MTANTLGFGEEAKVPWDIRIPREPPKEDVSPAIRGQQTHGMTNKQLELALHDQKSNYNPFILRKPQKASKRKTCLKKNKDSLQLEKPQFPMR